MKKKTQKEFCKIQDEYKQVRTESSRDDSILENQKLQEQVKQKSDEIQTLRKVLQKYSSSSVVFQNQIFQLNGQCIQDINKIIDSSQAKLLNFLDEQNTPKKFIKDDKIHLNIGKVSQDDQSQYVYKQEVGNIFSEMKLAIKYLLNNIHKIMPQIQDHSADYLLTCKIDEVFYGDSIQCQGEIATNQEKQLNSYQEIELNKLDYLKQVLDLEGNSPRNQQIQNLSRPYQQQLINKTSFQNQQINKFFSVSETQFDKKHFYYDDKLLLEDFENSSQSDFKNSEDKDLDSETSISIPQKTNKNKSKKTSITINSREESDFQQILKKNKLNDSKKETSLTTIYTQDSRDNQNYKHIKHSYGDQQYFKTEKALLEKQREQIEYHKKKLNNQQNKTLKNIVSKCQSKKFLNFSQKSIFYTENQEKINLLSQTNLIPKEEYPINNGCLQNNIKLTNMDFCKQKNNQDVLKIIDQIDEKNFFSDEVVKYSSNRQTEKKIIVLNSIYFYVFSQDPQEKHKFFLIEDINKIKICPMNKHLCSFQIKKQFQLIIEIPHVKFLIRHIQKHFKHVLKKNPPKIRVQKTQIYTNKYEKNNQIAQNFTDEQTTKQQFNLNRSDQKNQLKTDPAQLDLCPQFKIFIFKDPNNLLQQIQDQSWIEGFLILEKVKNVSALEEQIFATDAKLEVQVETDCFKSNQNLFKFNDQESKNYYIRLQQDFDIPILIKNIKCGDYKYYLNLYNYISY
ncbi:hypothetical protein ABPG72_015477 [Tetrahymena utriculariae]